VAEHVDVIVVGAGLSGIAAAYHLQTECPNKSFVLLEARTAIGGTWDLFRYPGVRSDSDMYTLGFAWKPWRGANAIADGASILAYVQETAREHGIDRKTRFEHRVKRASWSSERARWSVEVEVGPERKSVRFTCNFLLMCAGYYDYAAGYTPRFEGAADFRGQIVHPQHWTSDVDYTGKRVVVIGSGATAVTLVPALAERAAHVVMLQRSPSYVVTRPIRDSLAGWFRTWLPERSAYALARFKNVLESTFYYQLMRRSPRRSKRALIDRVRAELGPDYDVATHFTPRYDVWDQRLCLVPDGDFFEALRSGRASVVTDQIERFTATGIRLRSGQELTADLIVTATGLELQVMGGAELSVDGRRADVSQSTIYKGCMLTELPNLAFSFGYTNASWTLKAELTARYVCRVLRAMDRTGATRVTPRHNDPGLRQVSWLDLSSGYIQRALHRLPKQGDKRPFKLAQNYALDLLALRLGSIDDGVLEFAPTPKRTAAEGRAQSETQLRR
jgi:monooxygenase